MFPNAVSCPWAEGQVRERVVLGVLVIPALRSKLKRVKILRLLVVSGPEADVDSHAFPDLQVA